MLPETSIGHSASEVLYGWPNIFREYKQRTLAEIEIPAGKSKIFLEMQISPLFERGHLIGCIYATRNITERVDTENKSRLVRQNMVRETPGEFTPILLTLRARDGKILDVNNEFVFQTGYSRDEAIGHTPLQLGFWDIETRTNLTHLLHEKGGLTDYNLPIVSKSGEKQAWKLSVSRSTIDGEELHLWVARASQ
jgi:PAS domain S-box-containing protein